MKYAYIDTNNKLLGWYDSVIHTDIPESVIEVTEEQWLNAINNNHNKVNPDGTTERFDFRSVEEIQAESNLIKINDAKQYLADTDYKVAPDYDGDTTGILEARAEARTLIRTLESELEGEV